MKHIVTIILMVQLHGLNVTGLLNLSDKDELPPTLPQDTFDGPHNTSEIASFIDMVFKEEMERLHVPGATISLVRDGEIIYIKGYGLANAEQGLPVNPSKTPFFVASVSKLFTATAVMQLMEQGKLDLSENINHYLTAFKIDDNFPQPVTVANLLTHTGGFEERSLILAAFSKSDMLSREEYLTLGKQPRVLPPGRYISYSNYGYTLLGYLVEEISGIPFEQYMDEQILGPLDMQSSSFSYPDSLMSRLAISHVYAQNTWKPLPVLYANVGPAGALISTASDMANFMIMHLQNGVFRDEVLIQKETANQMHRQLFTQHPRLPGWCYGFYEEEINGRRLIQHGGDINNYASLLVLIPEENVGLFMVINGGKGLVFKFRENVLKRFMDHYYPSRIFDQSDKEVFYTDDIKRFSGVYRLNRYSRLSFEKILGAVLESRIKINPDRSLKLILPPVLDEPPSTWIRTDTLLFQNKKDGRYMVFYEDTDGHITHVNFSVQVPINAVRISWIHSGIFNLCLLIVILIVFLSVIPGWQIVWIIRKIRKRSKERDRWEKQIRILIILISGLNILFLIAFIIALITSVEKLISDYPVEFIFVFMIPIIGTIFTLILTGSLFPVWKNRLWPAGRRVYYTGILLFMITFLLLLHDWNFLGFHF